jgi:hypothetical protein
MAQPIIIQEASLRNYLANFREALRPCQWQYFETVLLGLIHCQANRTLSGLLRSVAGLVTVWDLSRFLVSPRWSAAQLAQVRYRVFQAEVLPLVAAAHAEQSLSQAGRRGRPRTTVVTGYLILDDSTHVKRYARKMGGQGWHYSSTDRRSMPGHSLFAGLYLLAGHQYPLDPQLYVQQTVCEQQGLPFRSKVDLAAEVLAGFTPVPETGTHVLMDSWYVNKRLWKIVRQRGWDLTGGLKANRSLRVSEATGQRSWQRLDAFAAGLEAEAFQTVPWPSQNGAQEVSAHLLRTRIKKLGAGQLLIVKPTAQAPASQARFFFTSRCTDRLEQVVLAAALRWSVETLFADFKELLGSDHYQLHSAEAIRRFWALGLCLYQYLDSLRHRLERLTQTPFTLGETLAWLRQRQEDLKTDWVYRLATGGASSSRIRAALKPALPARAILNC